MGLRSRLIAVAAVLAVAASAPAARAQGISLIRDAEIEDTIRTYASPIFAAAGLDEAAVRIYIVRHESLNAFVAGGQQLFINTGTLSQATEPGQVIGVIAHEVGHIAGGHLARLHDELRNARVRSVLGLLAGAAVAVATGNPEAAAVVGAGGQDVALKSLLNYTQAQEAAADGAALRYLDRTGQSARGLRDFFELLRRAAALSVGQRDSYLSTHPLTEARIAAVDAHLRQSPHAGRTDPPQLQARHDRMRAKLIGYLSPIAEVLQAYPDSDGSVAARYGRAVGYGRHGDLAAALGQIDSLVAELPDDPYMHETRGQILRDNGRLEPALAAYERAVALAPHEPLLHVAAAQVLLELRDPADLDAAIAHLETAVRDDPEHAQSWQLLAVAHGRSGREGDMALAQAEYSWRRGDDAAARNMAGRAERVLPPGSPGWLRAQDLLTQIDGE